MCPEGECELAFSDWTGWQCSQNVSRLWVWPSISCQTGLTDSAFSKCVQTVSVTWHFCQTGLPDSASSQNVSSGQWVLSGTSSQTGLANSALSKCVQKVSVIWHFLPNLTVWPCSLKMCPACECDLAFHVTLDCLTVPCQNVSRLWVWPGIFCQTGLADCISSKCIQVVSVTWHFLPQWTAWQCSLKMSPESEYNLIFSAKLDALSKCGQEVSVTCHLLEWLTVLSQNLSSVWVWSGISCQTGLADSLSALSKWV